MPRISQEESDARRNQVIDACAVLYRTMGYHDITMSQIAGGIMFGRANIYNYFQNKDEVFLALLTREHDLWAGALTAIAQDVARESAVWNDVALAHALAESLVPRSAMLKLLSSSLPDMEQNSRHERLVELKLAYGRALGALRSLLHAAKPAWDEACVDRFAFSFMPFLHGVHPYAFHSEKQLAAMEEARVPDPGKSVADLVGACALKLLQDDWGSAASAES